jgi:signal transduction histidine kinase
MAFEERPDNLASSVSVRVGFETARLRLLEIYSEGNEAQLSAYRIATQHSAATLGVRRVSIWALSEDGKTLSPELQFQDGQFFPHPGGVLKEEACPRYFEAIRSRRVVVVEDARNDPRTNQLLPYLEAYGIGALLDAPIYREGRLHGVVCHEHTDGPRPWTEKEAGFASAVADMLTILKQQAERAELRAAMYAQKQVVSQAQKMQALSKLGRVVIHDLANIMTIVTARMSMLGREANLELATRELGEALAYGNSLLSQLREFYDDRLPKSGVEVVQVIRSLESTLRATLGPSIQFKLDVQAEPTTLPVTRIEVEQLIMNLCVNAKDAISTSGSVEVLVKSEADRLLIWVSDTGVGMSEEQQARLFEPYYTTKPGHSGIGLAAVFGVVSRLQGRLDLDSAIGRGTTFRITLPIAAGPPSLDGPWSF